jgi:hypothetical protein
MTNYLDKGGDFISQASPPASMECRMNKPNVKSQRLVALFLLGNILFNFPLLTLFNRPDSLMGIPALYAYVFGAWILLIALLASVVEKR